MFLRAILLLFLILVIFLANGFINPIPERRADSSFKQIYGTSFSFEQAGWYGLDPRKTYVKLLEDFDFEWVRLPFFWDHPSTSSGQKDLDGSGNLDDLKFA